MLTEILTAYASVPPASMIIWIVVQIVVWIAILSMPVRMNRQHRALEHSLEDQTLKLEALANRLEVFQRTDNHPDGNKFQGRHENVIHRCCGLLRGKVNCIVERIVFESADIAGMEAAFHEVEDRCLDNENTRNPLRQIL